MTRGRSLRRPTRLVLVTDSVEPEHRCDRYALWTASNGYVATCHVPEHFGRPLSLHPSLVVAK